MTALSRGSMSWVKMNFRPCQRNHPVKRRWRFFAGQRSVKSSCARLPPLRWGHVNLTGDCVWSAEYPATENRDGFYWLSAAPDAAHDAA